jgi:hypothetical protein
MMAWVGWAASEVATREVMLQREYWWNSVQSGMSLLILETHLWRPSVPLGGVGGGEDPASAAEWGLLAPGVRVQRD